MKTESIGSCILEKNEQEDPNKLNSGKVGNG